MTTITTTPPKTFEVTVIRSMDENGKPIASALLVDVESGNKHTANAPFIEALGCSIGAIITDIMEKVCTIEDKQANA